MTTLDGAGYRDDPHRLLANAGDEKEVGRTPVDRRALAVLVNGLPGAGKTTVGTALSKLLSVPL